MPFINVMEMGKTINNDINLTLIYKCDIKNEEE